MRSSVLLFAASLLVAALPAFSKEKDKPGARAMADIEAQVKVLANGNTATNVAPKVNAFYAWLGLGATCPSSECKVFGSSQWVTANLDPDSDDERVLAITTLSAPPGGDAGACPIAHTELIVLDLKPDGWGPVAHETLQVNGGGNDAVHIAAAALHSSSVKDLIVRTNGKCDDGTRDARARFETFEHGKLEELANAADWIGDVVSYKIVGAPPATLELTDAKGTTKLYFDEPSFGYDPLTSAEAATKASVSKDTDDTLSVKECGGPLTPALVTDCGLTGSGKVAVTVQNGKPLGATVSSNPPQPAFVRCMRKKIATTTWKSVPGATSCSKTFALK